MHRNLIETLLGAVVLGVAGLFLAFAYTTADLGRTGGYEVEAEFTTIGGLKVGNDVRMAGIKIGSVVRQELDPQTYLARVTLSVDPSIELPADTSATIASEGLLGGNYVDLAPGGDPTMLKPGGRIQYTQDAVDMVQLLGKFIFSAGDGGTASK
ncbi:ATPase AAA [Thalassobaculum fulvum]|jgi:phospholipid/cholesterol/gamma-HCH transport system substrate-binding protein|uniref:ATPase AAA n=1 Tax=Thalassobaculum fulvum TaxID=1633335 RepID=A0A918XXK9_9PROT|nr:outer membrane lipid asymmetry maintenance protein MlaD [Thalassobaculum fulvum]GHD62973.1 ATPase AAA [Thalassobaculum fulvum]